MKHEFTAVSASKQLIEDRVAKLNRRGSKLGLAPVVVTFGETFMVDINRFFEYETPFPIFREYVKVAVEGPVIKKDGFTLIGMIKKDDVTGENMVISIGGSVPQEFFNLRAIGCAHCNRSKKRNAGFIYKNDETAEHVVIGKTCSHEYNGIEPSVVEFLGSIGSSVEGDNDGYGPEKNPVFKTADLVACMVADIAKNGYISKAQANENGGIGTSDTVVEGLTSVSPKAAQFFVRPTEEQRAVALEVIEWAKKEYATRNTEFAHNMKVTANAEYVGTNRAGFAAYLVVAFNKAQAAKVEAKSDVVDAYVGQVGDRRNFEGTFVGESTYDTDFGRVYIGRFQTTEGLVCAKVTRRFYDDQSGKGIEIGDVVKFKATIKQHKEFRGQKQTIVQRGVLV